MPTPETLTAPQVAARLGVKPDTWHGWVSRQRAPQPDGRHDRRTPYWYATTVDAWREQHPARIVASRLEGDPA